MPQELLALPRGQQVFEQMERDDSVIMELAPPGATAGKVLQSVSAVVQRYFSQHKPMKFMFGITHDVVFRFHNKKFGYKHSRNSFQRIVALYASKEPYSPAMLEATLIDKYGRH